MSIVYTVYKRFWRLLNNWNSPDNGFWGLSIIRIVQTTDLGDCLLVGIFCTIDLEDCLMNCN